METELFQIIFKKFKFTGAGIVINAPVYIKEEFIKLGFKSNFDEKVKSINLLVFIKDKKGMIEFLNNDLIKIEFDSVFWLAYPKGTSKIKTDIHRDIIRTSVQEFGITTVTAISIDDVWSALRFRPIEKMGK